MSLHLYPDQIVPGSDYEKAVTLQNAMSMLFSGVPQNMMLWVVEHYLVPHGVRLVNDRGFANYEQQVRDATNSIRQAHDRLTIVPSYLVSPMHPSNVTPRGNP